MVVGAFQSVKFFRKTAAIMFIIFWNFLLIKDIFLSPKLKGSVIISNKLVYMSYLTSCQTTEYLGSFEIKKN